jgi:hypothetical protein
MAKAVISKKNKVVTKLIETSDYGIIKIRPNKRSVTINEVLPFRVKFINIGIEGYSANNVPPIPLQVIGFSNYIL